MSLRIHEIDTLLGFVGLSHTVNIDVYEPKFNRDDPVQLTKQQLLDLMQYTYAYGYTDGSYIGDDHI